MGQPHNITTFVTKILVPGDNPIILLMEWLHTYNLVAQYSHIGLLWLPMHPQSGGTILPYYWWYDFTRGGVTEPWWENPPYFWQCYITTYILLKSVMIVPFHTDYSSTITNSYLYLINSYHLNAKIPSEYVHIIREQYVSTWRLWGQDINRAATEYGIPKTTLMTG